MKLNSNSYIHQDTQVTHDEFAEECLRSHNHFRAQHGCPPLHLSLQVSSFSQQWADLMSHEEHLHHSHHPQYGENIFALYISDHSLPTVKGSDVVESWYSEQKFYRYNGYVTREALTKAGHFTQVVWTSSRELGIGRSVSRSNRVYVVANYYPAGNVANKFSANVPKRVFESWENRQHSDRLYTKSRGFRRRIYFDSWID